MATFIPRLSDTGITNSPWWYSSGNPFYVAGYGMPNCTAYAYGRYAEARNAWANLPTGDGKDWYPNATSFSRGAVPALGAVMCWGQSGGSNAVGHVAIVEQVLANNDVVISESHYTSSLPFFDTQTLTASSGYSDHPYLGSSFYFQGFIYNDWQPGQGGGGQPIPPSAWQAKTTGGYSRTSNEALQNALCAYKKLYSLGWSLNAICAVWGNVGYESAYNPWRWEGDVVLASTDTSLIASSTIHGYGLPQFTPSGKYINSYYAQGYSGYAPNFSDVTGNPNDGDAQLEFIHNYADYYETTEYPITYQDFKTSTQTAGDLAIAWLYNYERPADPTATQSDRADEAEYWYGILSQYSPTGGKKKKKIWMFCGAPPLY